MNALLPILQHTPVGVWALLALILALGLRQTRGLRQGRTRLLLPPALWLLAGAASMAHLAGWFSPGMLAWWAGLALSLALVLRRGGGRRARYDADQELYHVPGSWAPLGLMLGLFASKYLSAVMLALHPHWGSEAGFGIGLGAVLGILAGALLGRPIGILRCPSGPQPATLHP
ncbi:DUF6622 family protein [Ideonella oryzae]|uniref:DUF1453 domain-containing protein n=1 Tax=Ideonella oryzae TaxID=2937441 RepID=A0ABT1BKT0_9BURK|nr:DUF6622 family protein [Ideonella oryzae]MCO5976017.1 hypothetical protein [Ideonella oryzae]